MNKLLSYDFSAYSEDLRHNLDKNSILADESLPSIEISEFNLPNIIGTEGLYEYAHQLVKSLSDQSNEKVNNFVQRYQAKIFRQYNDVFELEIMNFIQKVTDKIMNFEKKFGLSTQIQTPKVDNTFRMPQFDPDQIEKLKPAAFRVWLEKISPNVLNRELEFWNVPVSVKVGLIDVKVGIPIGLRPQSRRIKNTREELSDKAISLINEYVYNTVNNFVSSLDKTYSYKLDDFLGDWENHIREYIQQIEVAKSLTDSNSLSKIDNFLTKMKELHIEISPLMK